MKTFIFRNNTIENLFGTKDVEYSGYDDISYVPTDFDRYLWCYQVMVKPETDLLVTEAQSFWDKFQLVYQQIPATKNIIVFTLVDLASISYTNDAFELRNAIAVFNKQLTEFAAMHSNVKVVDFNEFLSQYPKQNWIDWKYFFISQMIFSPQLMLPFRKWWKRKMEEIEFKRKKCLVLDLDNTLWGGVLGEDGVNGIKIGGDYPGKAFLYFQEALVELSKRGIILTICSKNNEADVLEAWEKNPFIVLKKEFISAYRINWNDKASNIQALAKELNIGLDSMVFIDDNPTERELIKQTMPMVEVPEFPDQPYKLPVFFKILVDRNFRIYTVTDEDKKKTAQYKANALRAEAQTHFTDFTDFLKSLEMEVTVLPLDEFNLPRIAQMTQKTNQFNLTTRRYTDADVKAFGEHGWHVYCVSVKDKFGDNGITGTIMATPDGCIDELLLSCRILGKGIEFAFVKKVLALLKDEGITTITAEYIPTAKNIQVMDFYDRCGFTLISEQDGCKQYEADLHNLNLDIKDYYHIK